MSAQRWDAVVVGGGHNGLTCAAYLARAGRKVLVLERRHLLGGAAVTEEVYPGFKFSACSYVISLLRPWILRDLELPRHGLQILPLESTFTPHPDGSYLLRDGDPERTRRRIARYSPHDAEIYPEFGQAMGELGRLVKPMIDAPAFDPMTVDPRRAAGLARFGKRLLGRGEDWAGLVLKMSTMSAVPDNAPAIGPAPIFKLLRELQLGISRAESQMTESST
ncbi:MAG: phytoene desaturase family protein, partial [Thermoanaerobaculia bacterium]